MANTVTLAELRDGVQQITDTVGDRHKTASWLLTIINSARKEVFEILRRADPDFYESEQTIPTTGVASYALPANHHLTKAVEWLSTTTLRVPLRRVSLRERLDYQTAGVTGVSACAYRLVGATIVLYPTPPSGQTYFHVYVPAPVLLVADADVVDGREAQLIILRAAIQVALRDDGDVPAFEAEFARELARMTAQSEDRAINEPRTIETVEDYSNRSARWRARRWYW